MLPKSLHTVTTLVSVARIFFDSDTARGLQPASATLYVARACAALGYAGIADPHGLFDVAVRKLEKVLA